METLKYVKININFKISEFFMYYKVWFYQFLCYEQWN